MKGTLPVRQLVTAMSEDEAIDLANRRTLLTRGDVDHVATSSEMGLRPDGEQSHQLGTMLGEAARRHGPRGPGLGRVLIELIRLAGWRSNAVTAHDYHILQLARTRGG